MFLEKRSTLFQNSHKHTHIATKMQQVQEGNIKPWQRQCECLAGRWVWPESRGLHYHPVHPWSSLEVFDMMGGKSLVRLLLTARTDGAVSSLSLCPSIKGSNFPEAAAWSFRDYCQNLRRPTTFIGIRKQWEIHRPMFIRRLQQVPGDVRRDCNRLNVHVLPQIHMLGP